MSEGKVTVSTSFKLQEGGIIAELKHQEAGLGRGTLLISSDSAHTWSVKSRILFAHAPKQRVFDIEECEAMFVSFSSNKKRAASEKQIMDKESQGIYMYLLLPEGTEEVPAENDILSLDVSNVILPALDEEDDDEDALIGNEEE